MKDIRCLFGKHVYAQNDVQLNVLEEQPEYLKCKVMMSCTRCEKTREDIIYIAMPPWMKNCGADMR